MHQSVHRHLVPLEHIFLIPRQPVCSLFLLDDACLADTQQIPISESLTWHDRGLNPRSTVHETSKLAITPSMYYDHCSVLMFYLKLFIGELMSYLR